MHALIELPHPLNQALGPRLMVAVEAHETVGSLKSKVHARMPMHVHVRVRVHVHVHVHVHACAYAGDGQQALVCTPPPPRPSCSPSPHASPLSSHPQPSPSALTLSPRPKLQVHALTRVHARDQRLQPGHVAGATADESKPAQIARDDEASEGVAPPPSSPAPPLFDPELFEGLRVPREPDPLEVELPADETYLLRLVGASAAPPHSEPPDLILMRLALREGAPEWPVAHTISLAIPPPPSHIRAAEGTVAHLKGQVRIRTCTCIHPCTDQPPPLQISASRYSWPPA